RAYCLKTQPATGETYPKSDLFNKAHLTIRHLSFVSINQFPTKKQWKQHDKQHLLKLAIAKYKHQQK
ncbi:hypothetical protein V6166_25795, partial [Klebsiella pneumoniae]